MIIKMSSVWDLTKPNSSLRRCEVLSTKLSREKLLSSGKFLAKVHTGGRVMV